MCKSDQTNLIKKVYTSAAPAAIGPYSQAIIAGNMLYASGQIPVNPETGEVAGNNIVEQTTQVMENISAVLSEAKVKFENVVKTTCFLNDMSDFGAFNSVYEKYFAGKPARSCVAVKGLPKSVLVEVEFTAICE